MDNSSSDGASAFDSPMQARVAGRDLFGKFDDHLPEVRIPFEVKQLAERAAREDGFGDLTSWIRGLVYARLMGPEHLAMLHKAQYERALGNAGQNKEVMEPPSSALPRFLQGAAK